MLAERVGVLEENVCHSICQLFEDNTLLWDKCMYKDIRNMLCKLTPQ